MARQVRPGLLIVAVIVVLGVLAVLYYPQLRERWTQYVHDNAPLPEPARPLAVSVAPTAAEDDWPQWRGPHRDGVSRATGLLREWPAVGPRLLWSYAEAGRGYSAPAVVGGKVFVLGARDHADMLRVLDARTGTLLGEAVLGRSPIHTNYGDGPRCTPTIDGGRVYTVSNDGELVCLDIAAGRIVWQHNMYRDGAGVFPMFGCSESPLVDGATVVCMPGGEQGAVQAFDKATGKEVWRSKEFPHQPGYSSLMPGEFGGVRQYVVMDFAGVAGIAAADGRLLWQFPRPVENSAVPTPLFADGHVYVTSGSGDGCHLIRLRAENGRFTAEKVYSNKGMSNHIGGVVRVGDHVYGYSDHKGWVCQEFLSGRTVWSEKQKLGKGSITAFGDRLICYDERDGTACLVGATPEEWKEYGRVTIPNRSALPSKEGKVWSHPVIADGKLFLRDQEWLFCYDLKGTRTD
jgi:outer membrane protein assembly factor BamB